jgi:hypothetical protein
MGKVFISYSRNDIKITDKFANLLHQSGMETWIDRESIKVGNSWRKEIVEAIDECDAFVFMMSSNSVASKNVHKEIILSQVVRLPAEIRYQLAGLQFINFQLLGFEKSAAQLIEALKPHQKKTKPDENKQAELVIQGIDISAFTAEKQAELLAFISKLTDTNTSQLKIANVVAGSVHVFVDMPADSAIRLKTFALNQNNSFAPLGIAFLRLVGDKNFINISFGTFTPTTSKKTFNKLVFTFFIVLIALLGIEFFVLRFSEPQPISTPTSASTLTATLTPVTTSTLTPTAETVATTTLTQIPTQTLTPEPVIMNAVVADHLSCNHGPGQYFLYRYGFIEGLNLTAYGKDIHSEWVYVQGDGYEGNCWVNLNQINLDGNVDNLKVVYPGEVGLPLSFIWPLPQNVYTARTSDGNQIAIYWDEYILPDGEIESPNSARYLLELWTCKNGDLTFEAKFVWDDDIVIEDEAGCSEPSHGVIYLVEKHGYAGPVEIPWTAP